MDWAAIGSRDAVRAVCARFRVDYAQAEAHLLGQQQRGQAAEERAEVLLVDDGAGGAGRLAATITQQTEKQEDDEEEEEEEEGGAINNLESGGIIPMLGQDLVSVCATVGGGTRGEVICLDGTTHGTGEEGGCVVVDGPVAVAQFGGIMAMLQLPDGRVLVADAGDLDGGGCLRVLSADLQQVRTLTSCFCFGYGVAWPDLFALELLPDGRLLVGGGERIHVLEGFPAVRRGAKPSDKRRPQTTTQQQQQQTETEKNQKKKRALAGGASSSSGGSSMVPVPKRSRSGASSSSSMAAAPSSSDSESESEAQPGGAAAEAAPLL